MGVKLCNLSFLFLLRVHPCSSFLSAQKIGSIDQPGATQLVKSRGSFDTNIPRDKNVGQYDLFTFVVTGLRNVGSGTKKAKYNLQAVKDSRELRKLRKLYDTIEQDIRGLRSLDVEVS